ncbi:MAG: hypothetical protein OXC31_23465, partial [Spirochaetaceae bacterium]|nr:hypothetical protein [Spirochaetaceae bacterium]
RGPSAGPAPEPGARRRETEARKREAEARKAAEARVAELEARLRQAGGSDGGVDAVADRPPAEERDGR